MGTLRQVLRQTIVARQIEAEVPARPPRTVLDIGCGQGTQALALARRGHAVTGLDTSSRLLADFRAALAEEPAEVRGRVRLVEGDAERIVDRFGPDSFDVVLCHGVLMYFADPGPLLNQIAQVAKPGATISLLVRNGDALAMRPALLGDWPAAEAAFTADTYLNRIGARARADHLADLRSTLAARRLPIRQWYGVRVFTDALPSDEPLPAAEILEPMLRAEERAGRTDPYRRVAALLHVIATKDAGALYGP
nr:methyltransferase domain-containing protein [Streptomyces coryli]